MQSDSLRQSYRRGQVEWALWQLFSKTGPDTPIELGFRNRIKRLVEIDKTLECRDGLANAFGSNLGSGSGRDTFFTEIDGFCLAIALDLLDAGFNQQEIVLLLRHIRRDLEQYYSEVLTNPPTGREYAPAHDRPSAPSFERDGQRWADPYVFVLLQKIELEEVWPPMVRAKMGEPRLLKPEFYRGHQELQRRLKSMPITFRKALVIEIAQTAASVRDLLGRSPEIRRGRRS